jgi:hypothetical protein
MAPTIARIGPTRGAAGRGEWAVTGVEPIAYTGTDRQLYVLGALDGEPRRLTDDPDATHTWPTWAPGRAALAAMRRPRGAQAEQASVVLWVDPMLASPGPTDAPRALWTARDGGPVYMGWAPDGSHLAMLVQEANDLHLLVAEPREVGARTLLSGSPLYWSWTGDGRALVVHVGGHYRYGEGARVLLLRLDANGSRETLSDRPLGFRAPACEPGGQRVAYARDAGGHGSLVVTDLSNGREQPLAVVGDEPAFVWAPGGGRLAVGGTRADSGLYDELTVLDAQTGTSRALGSGVLAFFWTPDGTALICALPDPVGEGLAWERIDVADGRAARLATFTPTQELALLLGHFDQYAQSVSLYSREEPWLLFSNAGDEARHNGNSAEHAELWLARGDAPAPLRRLAGGSVGFFAP